MLTRRAQAALSTDMISGFCGETEAEHADTLDLMRGAAFEQAFMFAYSERPKTAAARTLADDVPPATKARRLGEVIAAFREAAAARNAAEVGRAHLVRRRSPCGHCRLGETQLPTGAELCEHVAFTCTCASCSVPCTTCAGRSGGSHLVRTPSVKRE